MKVQKFWFRSRRRGRVGGVVLRNGLHGPLDVVPRFVLHGGMKTDSRRIGVEVNRAPDLNPGLRVGGTNQLDFALLAFRNLSKGVRAVVEQIGIAHPLLLVVVSLGQEPELVASVVKPAGWVGRQVFSFVLGIHEEERMSVENHLHQSSAILRYDFQFEPAIGKLLCAPTLVIRGLDATRRTRLARLSFSLGRCNVQVQQPKKQSHCVAPHHVLFLDPRCHDTCPMSDRSSYCTPQFL